MPAGRRRRDRLGDKRGEPAFGDLPVLQLSTLLGDDHRQDAVDEPAGKPLDRPSLEWFGQSLTADEIPAQLDPRVRGIDALPARPA